MVDDECKRLSGFEANEAWNYAWKFRDHRPDVGEVAMNIHVSRNFGNPRRICSESSTYIFEVE
jgi:hypothetical protein